MSSQHRLRLHKPAAEPEYRCTVCCDTGIVELDQSGARKGMSAIEYVATCVAPCVCERGDEQRPLIEKEQELWKKECR